GGRARVGGGGASVELPGSRQSPAPWPVETHPEPGSHPSPPVLLSGGSKRYCGPLRHPALLPPNSRSESRDPSQHWVSRVAPCSVSTCHAHDPGERSRCHGSVAPAGSNGLPCSNGRSGLTTPPSRPPRASFACRPG